MNHIEKLKLAPHAKATYELRCLGGAWWAHRTELLASIKERLPDGVVLGPGDDGSIRCALSAVLMQGSSQIPVDDIRVLAQELGIDAAAYGLSRLPADASLYRYGAVPLDEVVAGCDNVDDLYALKALAELEQPGSSFDLEQLVGELVTRRCDEMDAHPEWANERSERMPAELKEKLDEVLAANRRALAEKRAS